MPDVAQGPNVTVAEKELQYKLVKMVQKWQGKNHPLRKKINFPVRFGMCAFVFSFFFEGFECVEFF
ncbi:MAG: hypothetical protein H7839_16150 [Magnetococcus sp. YQC-5]